MPELVNELDLKVVEIPLATFWVAVSLLSVLELNVIVFKLVFEIYLKITVPLPPFPAQPSSGSVPPPPPPKLSVPAVGLAYRHLVVALV